MIEGHVADQCRTHIKPVSRNISAEIALSQDRQSVALGQREETLYPLLLHRIDHRTHIEILVRCTDAERLKPLRQIGGEAVIGTILDDHAGAGAAGLTRILRDSAAMVAAASFKS